MWIDGVTFTNHSGVSVNEIDPSLPLLPETFPNPFSSYTQVDIYIPSNGMALLEVYDSFGRVISTVHNGYTTQGNHKLSIDGNSLPKGFYFLKLKTQAHEVIRKMIKM